MPSKFKITDQSGAYFLTFTIIGWVDLFTRKAYRDIVIDSLVYCQKNKGLNLFAYVIMSNHIHLLAQSEKEDLSGFVRDFKSFTSKKFIEVFNSNKESRRDWIHLVFNYHGKTKEGQDYQIWDRTNHPVHIFSDKFLSQKINYIHNNPVKNGLVANPEDYLYSSARNYANTDSVIDVITLPLPWKTY
jgi:REP element-mobilizing transposase RayT